MERKKNWKNELVLRGRQDPAWWIENVLGDTLWSRQNDICQSVVEHERTAVVACVDKETEILTELRGFQLFKDLKPGDKVATLIEGKMEFVLPTAYHEYDYDGELIGIKSKSIDCLITPNHRCLVQSMNQGVVLAGPWQIKLAEDLYGKTTHRFTSDFIWEGVETNVDEKIYEFFGFFCGDGYAEERGYGIRISQKHYVDYVEDLVSHFAGTFDTMYRKQKQANGYDFILPGRNIWELIVNDFGRLKSERRIPQWLKDSKPTKLRAFLKGFMLADGSGYNESWEHHEKGKTPSVRIYYETLANAIQEIGMRAGFSAYLRKIKYVSGYTGKTGIGWYIAFGQRGKNPWPLKRSWYKQCYQDKVYCVTVPSGIICVRRNGMYHWTGNSFGVGKCIGLNERIPLSDGRFVYAKDLIGLHFGVLAFDEETHQQISTLAFAKDNGVKAVFEITTKLGRKLIRTENHPLYSGTLVKEMNRLHVKNPQFREIKDLKIGDVVLIPKMLNNEGSIRGDDRDAKLVGYLLGDGCTSVGVNFTQMENKQKQEFISIVESFGGKCTPCDDLTLRVTGEGDTSDNKKFEKGRNPILNKAREWGLLGKTSKTKKFPDWVWTLPNDQLALVINRYFSCDGWAYVNERENNRANVRIGVTSASEEMIRDVELAMLRFGIVGMIRKRDFVGKIMSKSKGKEYDVKGGYWTWECYKAKEVERFSKFIGIFGKEPALEKAVRLSMQRINFTKTAKWIHEHTTDEFIWDTIKSITYVGEQSTVAISVPKYHTYISTIVEHNTHLAARIALWFLCSFKPSKVITTAPTLRQVKDLLWSELRNAHKKAIIPIGGELLQLSLKFDEDHFCVGFSTDAENIDRFTGFHQSNLLVIFDQAGGIDPNIWEASEGLMTSANCKWLAISNSAISDGELANICMPDRRSRFGTWNILRVKASESPNVVAGKNIIPGLVAHDWVKKREEAWGRDDPLYKIFVEAEFIPDSEMVVVPYKSIVAAFENRGELGEHIQVGLDVARMGTDSTVWTAISGSKVLEIKRLTGNTTMQVVGSTVEFVRHLQQKYQLPVSAVKVDVIGLGAGVYDRLVELDEEDVYIPAIAVNNAEMQTVIDRERYLNIRAEMAWMFRHRMEQGGVGFNDVCVEDYELKDYVRGDIQAMRYQITSQGKIKIIAKEDLRKILGRSPDYWDSLVMAFETPSGGPPSVEAINTREEEEVITITEEEWQVLLGTRMPKDDQFFRDIYS